MSLEYVIVLSLVFLGAALALVLLGPTLLRRYEWLHVWALLPIP